MTDRKSRLIGQINGLLNELSGQDFSQEDPTTSFFELGLDSLLLTQVSLSVKSQFGVKVTFRQMMSDLDSVSALAVFLDQELSPETGDILAPKEQKQSGKGIGPDTIVPTTQQTPSINSQVKSVSTDLLLTPSVTSSGNGGNSIERVVRQQLQIMTQQLEMLRHSPDQGAGRTAVSMPIQAASPNPLSATMPLQQSGRPVVKAVRGDGDDNKRFGPFKGVERGPTGGLTTRQEKALAALVANYNERTAASKDYAQRHRSHLCDPRAAGNFRQLWKEMVYPIVCARSLGSRIWDIDGNEYIDVTMGFGADFLGHSPDYVMEAIETQMKLGVEIGPQSPLAGETAQIICELTGLDRATFCNTGSEAVMAAIRVSRTVTGKDKIVFFRGDYHGVFDEVLARPALVDGLAGAMPAAPGIPHLPNIIVLEYGNVDSLEIIKTRAAEIAAVLIEPIQARHPNLQPKDFIQALREMTTARDIALIFDEVITGFRLAPGGAQEFYGVKADLATYGKVIGGGMPIGVLAGKAKFMDALDGGTWQYGDDSYPETGVTFFAGTFVRHPLAMAAANAVARHLKTTGPSLQQAINERTSRFIQRVNALFAERGLPMRFEHFSAVFFYDFHPDLQYANLLFYYLRNRGIHIWEGRIGHFSVAHTDEDFDLFYQAIRDSIIDMQEAGFLPPPAIKGNQTEILKTPLNHKNISSDSGQLDFIQLSFPLAEPQREMWLGAQMQPMAAGPHHACTGIWLEGPLDISKLRRAIDLVLERHEGLRSSFSADGTEVIVHPPNHFEQFAFEDISRISEDDRVAIAESIFSLEASKLLDLENGPLVTFRLLRLEPERHLLIFTAQMIVCDGWSHYVVFEDLGTAYSDFTAGKDPVLQPPIPMREFAYWQLGNAGSEEAKECEAFWLSQFIKVPPVLNLPTSRLRPPTRTFDASRCVLELDKNICRDIRRIARERRTSYVAALLAVFQVWLHRLTGCRDLVVGMPFAAQEPLGMDRLVGQCANILPLRSPINPDGSFAKLLASTWANIIDAKENWNFSFSQLASVLNLPNDPSRLPLVSVLFNVDPAMTKVKFSGLRHHLVNGPRNYFQYDIGFNLIEEGETIRVECDYNTNLFDSEVISVWTKGYKTLIQGIVQDVHMPVGSLPMLTANESSPRKNPEVGFENIEQSIGSAIHRLVAEQAKLTPETIAIESNGFQLSYGELEYQAGQLANKLEALGIGPGTQVGVYLEHSVRLPVALLSVLKLGAVCLPIDKDVPSKLTTEITAASHTRFLLVDSQVSAFEKSVAVQVIEIQSILSGIQTYDRGNTLPTTAFESCDDIACILNSSLVKGEFEGVQICHSGLVNLIRAMQVEPGFGPLDVMLAISPISLHSFWLELFLPLSIGARVVIEPSARKLTQERLTEIIERHGITVMQATPSTWHRLLKDGWAGSHRLRAWSGGETLHYNLVEMLLPRCQELWNLYGSAETSGWSMVCRVQPGSKIHLGKPILGNWVQIVDGQLQPVVVGVPGEILISGAGLARGYLGQPELAKRDFIRHNLPEEPPIRKLRSGDLAKYSATGQIEFLGKLNSLVEVRGFIVELEEVEATILRHEAIHQAVVVAHGENQEERFLVGYLVPKNEELQLAEVWSFLGCQLPRYMIPSQLIFLKSLPLTWNNKSDRNNLPKPLVKQQVFDDFSRNCNKIFVAPQTPSEKVLSEIWSQVLRIPRIGVHDNFFDLGGQSILAMKVIMQASKLGLALKPRSIFLNQTIAELGKEADESAGRLLKFNGEQWNPFGNVPLTPAQARFLSERATSNPHRWNYSVTMQAKNLSPHIIEEVLKGLLAHHDALRLRLTKESIEWNQFISEDLGEVSFESHVISSLTPKAKRAYIEKVCEELQSSLHLTSGPVFRVAHFASGPEEQDRLVFVMHHFVMDVFSWDVFWEDFVAAYQQGLAGEEISFPRKTTSFREWSMRLKELADSSQVRDTVPQWLELPWNMVGHLPVDFAGNHGANTNASACDFELILSAKESAKIVRPDGDNRSEDLMLAALAKTLVAWNGTSVALIDRLNHGRGIVEEANLSRTVGFMLFYQPVVLQVGDRLPGDDTMRTVTDQIRKIPVGFTFDLLRFCVMDESIRNTFKKLPRSEVLFNFTGQQDDVDPNNDKPIFSLCDNPCGSDFDPQNGRYYLLAVSAAIVEEQLRFKFVYSKNLHRHNTIKRLATQFRKNLLDILKSCSRKGTQSEEHKENSVASRVGRD